MEEFVTKWLYNPTVGKIVAAIITILVIITVVRFIKHSVSRYVDSSDTRYRVRKFISFLGYLAAALILTVIFSDKLGSLTVAFGVAGAGIAFALQEVIASVAGWFAISFANFYSPGDRVQLGGIKGDVIDIGILRTTLMEVGEWVKGDLYSGRVVLIANSFVFKEPVFNYSGDFPFLWDEIVLPIKYGSDRRLAREIMTRVINETVGDYSNEAAVAWQRMLKKYRLEEAGVEPTITLIANDNWLEYTIRYVVDYKKRRSTKDQLFTLLLDEFDKTEGRVGIASATFHLVEAPAFDVRLSDVSKIQNK